MHAEQDCPGLKNHTPTPRGYLEWHEWAKAMLAQGSHQITCLNCMRLAIWVGPKPPLDPSGFPSGCIFQPRQKRWGKAQGITA